MERVRPSPAGTRAAKPVGRQHVWVWVEGTQAWVCCECGARTRFPKAARWRRAACQSVEGFRKLVHASHRCFCTWAEDDTPLVFCAACGAYGTTRPKALSKACNGRVACASRHKLLMAGRHPITRAVCRTPARFPVGHAGTTAPSLRVIAGTPGPCPSAVADPLGDADDDMSHGVGPTDLAHLAELDRWANDDEDAPMLGWEGLDDDVAD